ncbi:Predicted Fe-Mo cluster-binding protein, NifX family [Desulfacinum hydrothermale DSM 13146]|uniref:Predicted Fe-Mo cluster-binding protein, NifX family n=1 Tax=Desulfacinum hydrothermale DSM 13146 TaxID=1121390 RepID=A0A1W1WXM4_9BACT|nr:NifB/NifX family molybdenum-iron cluster-binding protein [Desulfacinum hydrothermale]SMC16472.1 Predicted Fe-Mo cluster-binding protein, NifX family [Desulfacinum hydrothermale DSM 13146]
MKVAVSSSGEDLNSPVDARFGRAPYFLMVDTETLDYQVVPNTQNLQASQGAGIQAATTVSRHKPDAVLTGHCGPKAFRTLQAAGIPVYTQVSGTIREAVENFKRGVYAESNGPDVEGHWG